MRFNIVEAIASELGEEMEQSPCRWGNVVVGHACYCHHQDGPRKCRLYWGGEAEMTTCPMFERPTPPEGSS